MSKEYTGYTAESSHFCNNKVTLAFVPTLLLAKPNKFNELYDEKSSVKVMMQEGKGDNANRIRYNMTVDEFIYVAENFKNNTLEIPVYLPKATQKPISEGEFAGYYYTSEFKLEYLQGYNNPWKVSLRCGYSKELGKMDINKKNVQTFLTRSELYKHFDKGLRAIEAFIRIYADNNIRAGYQELAKLQKGNFDPNENNMVPVEAASNGSHNGENNIAPNQVHDAPMQSVQQTQQPEKVIRQMKLQVISPPMAVGNSVVCQILIAGNTYNMYCRQFGNELEQSLANGTILEANLFEYQGLLCYDGPVR